MKAYLIGLRIGDLYVTKTHPNSPTIKVQTNTTQESQIWLIRKLFREYGRVSVYPRDRRGARSVRAFLNNSFSFLIPKNDGVPLWIRRNGDAFCAFLGGYIDAEGSFITKRNKVFSIQTQDKKIMKQMVDFLNKQGVLCKPPHISRRAGVVSAGVVSRRDVFVVQIYQKKELINLINLVENYIMHPKRRRDMVKLLNKLNYVRT